ncbi:MAG: tetratricopeptide repeat protein [Candidatus Binataceae bacterium]
MRERLLSKHSLAVLILLSLLTPPLARADTSIPPSNNSAVANGGDADAKAQTLVNAAINMTNSAQAVKLLWQATNIDPTLQEAYLYLGLFYQSRSDFGNMVKVYQKLIKYEPKSVSAYLNIGEAYMSFSPPKFDQALPYYRKAFELDPTNSFAALRIGEIYAQQGDRNNALRYLKTASADSVKNPSVASEADKVIRQLGAL